MSRTKRCDIHRTSDVERRDSWESEGMRVHLHDKDRKTNDERLSLTHNTHGASRQLTVRETTQSPESGPAEGRSLHETIRRLERSASGVVEDSRQRQRKLEKESYAGVISMAGGSRDSRQIASCRGCRSHTCPSRVLKPQRGHVFRPITQPWTRYEDMGHRWAFRPPKPELVVCSQGVPTSPGERHVYRGRRCRERSASNPGLLFQTQALPSANAIGWWTSRKST